MFQLLHRRNGKIFDLILKLEVPIIENTFLRFFENPKNATFYVFLMCHLTKRRKRYPSFHTLKLLIDTFAVKHYTRVML